MDFFQIHRSGRCADARNGQRSGGILHRKDRGAEAAGDGQGRFVISARGIAAQMGGSFCQGGSQDGPLGKALGTGHLEGRIAGDGLPVAVQGLLHGRGGPLSGGGCLVFREGGVGIGGAFGQAVQPALAARFAHAERNQAVKIFV